MNLKYVSMFMKTAGLILITFFPRETGSSINGAGLLLMLLSWYVLNYHYSKSFIP